MLWYLCSTYFNRTNATDRAARNLFSCLAKDLACPYPWNEQASTLQRPWHDLGGAMPPNATTASLRALANPGCQLPWAESIQSTIQSFAPDYTKEHFFSPGCSVLSQHYPRRIVTAMTNLWRLNFVKGICRHVRFKHSKQFKSWHV